jgi:hypothetical protein
MPMLKAVLPNGHELKVAYSNIAPCSTISESLVEELGLTMHQLKKTRHDIAQSPIGGSFGGNRKQWYFVKELTISLPVTRAPDWVNSSQVFSNWANLVCQEPNTDTQDIILGPLLVLNNLCPLVMGKDFMRAANGSMLMLQHYYGFPGLNVISPCYPLEFYNSAGERMHGSCSWYWNDGVDTNVCASCHFEFPQLVECGQCRCTHYCSKACQKEHWREHKKVCKKVEKVEKVGGRPQYYQYTSQPVS